MDPTCRTSGCALSGSHGDRESRPQPFTPPDPHVAYMWSLDTSVGDNRHHLCIWWQPTDHHSLKRKKAPSLRQLMSERGGFFVYQGVSYPIRDSACSCDVQSLIRLSGVKPLAGLKSASRTTASSSDRNTSAVVGSCNTSAGILSKVPSDSAEATVINRYQVASPSVHR